MAVIEAIATTYLEADAASVTFSSIPATYEHLQLRMSWRDGSTGTYGMIKTRFNGDTGNNYQYHLMRGYGTTAATDTAASTDYIANNFVIAEGSPRTGYTSAIVDILDYANTNKNTTTQTMLGSVSGTVSQVVFHSGMWDSTAAVNTILLTYVWGPDILRGTEVTLYGLNSS